MLTILRNADLYAPEPLGTRTLVLGGERVLWIGDEDDLAVDARLVAEERDLGGAIVIPGLVDCHAHTTGGGGEAGAETRVPTPNLGDFTRHGVTSVVGMLGTDGETRSMAEVLASTRALRTEGLSAWCLTGGYHLPPATLTGSLRGDLVHLDAVVGIGELALSDFRSSQPSLAELLRVASEAQVGALLAGKKGVLHLHLGDGERGLELVRRALDESELPARLFHPTHVNRRRGLFDEALHLAERGATIDVTAFPVAEGEDAWSAPDAIERYLDAGLAPERLTVSSDSGGCLPHFDGEGRMTNMDVGAADCLLGTVAELCGPGGRGRALADVLPVFTSNPAGHLGLGGTINPKGRLGAGSDADLVVLDDQLRATDVMARGRWHVRVREQQICGTFESPRT